MDYTINKHDNYLVLELKGSLLADVQSKEILQNASEHIQNGDANFVIDLKDLKFINSSGLGMMLTLLTKSRKSGGDVVLANVPEQVNNLLVMTKLTAIFKSGESIEEAGNKLGA
jgi:anti-sigma B factor antagonist